MFREESFLRIWNGFLSNLPKLDLGVPYLHEIPSIDTDAVFVACFYLAALVQMNSIDQHFQA